MLCRQGSGVESVNSTPRSRPGRCACMHANPITGDPMKQAGKHLSIYSKGPAEPKSLGLPPPPPTPLSRLSYTLLSITYRPPCLVADVSRSFLAVHLQQKRHGARFLPASPPSRCQGSTWSRSDSGTPPADQADRLTDLIRLGLWQANTNNHPPWPCLIPNSMCQVEGHESLARILLCARALVNGYVYIGRVSTI
jgi:hypothetical protein